MDMINRKIFKIVVLCAVMIMGVGCLDSVQADPLMRLKRPKLRVSALPGGTGVDTIEIENPADKDTAIKVYLEDWEYKDATGAKNFYSPGTIKLSATNWISFYPKEFTLPPFGKKTVHVSVNVPEDAEEGKYAVLFFETAISSPVEDDMSEAALTVLGRIGTLIYVEPEGKINRDGILENLKIEKKEEDPGYMIKGKFTNSGNVDAIVEGTFNIIDKNGEVFARGSFDKVYTLQGDKADIVAEWDEVLPEGKYDMIVSLDAAGKSIFQEKTVEINSEGNILK